MVQQINDLALSLYFTAVWVQSLVWELLYAVGEAKKKKKKFKRTPKLLKRQDNRHPSLSSKTDRIE